MGNTMHASSLRLKSAIINRNLEGLRALLQRAPAALNSPVNEKGDTPLMFACQHGCVEVVRFLLEAGAEVNCRNRQNRTALDLAIYSLLPADGDIIYRYRFESQQGFQGGTQPVRESSPINKAEVPSAIRVLMEAGGIGRALERLILYVMRDENQVRKVIEIVDDIDDPNNFRISGLLLQITVWFEQHENLTRLLEKGVDIQHFWSASFMPKIEPSGHPIQVTPWAEEDEDEYTVTPVSDSDPLQELKFLFVQEWWADWNEGEHPCAQYRAGLHLTPECAVYFVRAANSALLLSHIMYDVMQYLPPVCFGPDLRNTCLLNCLTMAGYVFTKDEQQHLRLKFHIDFEPHEKFHKNPKKLRHLCRISIRFNFRTNVHLAVDRLSDLPMPLRDFLLLESDISL